MAEEERKRKIGRAGEERKSGGRLEEEEDEDEDRASWRDAGAAGHWSREKRIGLPVDFN